MPVTSLRKACVRPPEVARIKSKIKVKITIKIKIKIKIKRSQPSAAPTGQVYFKCAPSTHSSAVRQMQIPRKYADISSHNPITSGLITG